ncbi:MAG: DUF5655 domain-containing protein [Bdellovibrionota bacterium]
MVRRKKLAVSKSLALKKIKSKTQAKVKTKSKAQVKTKAKPHKSAEADSKSKKAKTKYTGLTNCHNCLMQYDPAVGHECEPVSERQLISQLNEDLQDAFNQLREQAVQIGEQRIYNNARAVMFARRVCYMFMRPKKKYIEVCFFLPKKLNDPSIHQTHQVSKTKVAHTVRMVHPDQVGSPLTDWLSEAFLLAE